MRFFFVTLVIFALAAVAVGQKNVVYDNQNDAVTNAPVTSAKAAKEMASAASGEESHDAHVDKIVAIETSMSAEKKPSNAQGILSIPEDADLRNKDNDVLEPEAARDSINGGNSDDDEDIDQQEEDEEDEDKDADDEARWERYESKLEDELARAHTKVKSEKLLSNVRKPTWPLALKASPRLPTMPRDLQRLTTPRDLSLSFDWKGKTSERTGVRFPHSDALNSKDWTISFVLKLDKHSTTGGWHNIINKGHNSRDRAPGVWLSNVNRLWTRLYTDHHNDEGFHSKATIRPGVPTHVAIVRRERTFALFIDGNLDSHMVTLGNVLHNDGPVHISRSPGYLGFNGELYTLRWYSRALSISEIRKNAGVNSARPVIGLNWHSEFNNDDLDVVNVPHDKSMETKSFTVAFWITLDQDSTGAPRSVFHKGGLKSLTPSCFLMARSRRLSCHISTSHGPDEQVLSKSVIPLHTPTHIALVRSGRLLTIFIDGVQDAQVETHGYTAHNQYHLSIGTSRWSRKGQQHSAGFVGKLDSFTWIDAPFTIVEVRRNMERESPIPALKIDAKIDFKEGDRIVVPHIPSFRSQAFTVSLWVNLREHATRKHDIDRPDRDYNLLFRKGSTESQNTPSIWFKPSAKASRLQVRMSTTHSFREMFDSTSSVKVGRPTKISLVMEGKVIRLYIDDVEDAVYVMRGVPVENFGPVFIGSDPHSVGTQGEIEDFRWWSRPLSHTELLSVSPHKKFRYWTPPLVGGPAASVESTVSFNGFNMLSFPDSNLRTGTFSIAAWITLGRNAGGSQRAIFAKGRERGQFTPLVHLMGSKKLRVSIATSHNKKKGESKVSAHAIEEGVPVHVAIVVNGRDLKIFINGILDSYATLVGDPVLNDAPWTIGKSSTHAGIVGDFSQIRIYTHALLENDVRAIASGASRESVLDFRWNGALTGDNSVEIPHSHALDSAEMTIACWVTVKGDPNGAKRVIWQKGDTSNQKTPTAQLLPNSNHIEVQVSTSRLAVETLSSQHVLAKGVPTSVVFVLRNSEMELYINGLLDSRTNLQGSVVFNQGPYRLGETPFNKGGGFVGDISSMKIYPRALDSQEIMEFGAAVHVPSAMQFDIAGKFDSKGIMKVPHSPIFNSGEFTVMFWLTLRGRPTTQWAAIMHKGGLNTERAPGIFRYPNMNKLFFAVSTEKDSNAGMTVDKNLVDNIPSHIAMTVSSGSDEQTVKVFIDGEHQGTLRPKSQIKFNNGPLYIGGDLWYENINGVITGFKILPTAYSRADVIQEMAKNERF